MGTGVVDTVESNCRSEPELTFSCALRPASREPDGLRKHAFILDHQAQFINHMQLPLRGGRGGGVSNAEGFTGFVVPDTEGPPPSHTVGGDAET